MPEREQIEINLKTTADTSGAKETTAELEKIAVAQKALNAPALEEARSSARRRALAESEITASPNLNAARQLDLQREGTRRRDLERRRIEAENERMRREDQQRGTESAGAAGPFGPEIEIARNAAVEKTRINKEFYDNFRKDRRAAQQEELAEQDRLYKAKVQGDTQYSKLHAQAVAEGRTVTGQGPFGQEVAFATNAAKDKLAIDKEYYANQSKDSQNAARAELDRQDRLYKAKIQNASQFSKIQAQAIKEGGIVSGQGPFGEEISFATNAAKDKLAIDRDFIANQKKDRDAAAKDELATQDRLYRARGQQASQLAQLNRQAKSGGGGGGGDGGGGILGGIDPNGIVRFGAALAGLGIGLSVYYFAGRALHDVLQEIINVEESATKATISLTAAFTNQTRAYESLAETVAAGGAGAGLFKLSDVQNAVTSLNSLRDSLNLSQQDLSRLVVSAARLAAIHDLPIEEVAQALAGALSGASQATDKLGLSLGDVAVASRYAGGSFAASFGLLTSTEQAAARLSVAEQQVAEQTKAVGQNIDPLAAAVRTLGAQWEGFNRTLGNPALNAAALAINGLAKALEGVNAAAKEIQKLPLFDQLVQIGKLQAAFIAGGPPGLTAMSASLLNQSRALAILEINWGRATRALQQYGSAAAQGLGRLAGQIQEDYGNQIARSWDAATGAVRDYGREALETLGRIYHTKVPIPDPRELAGNIAQRAGESNLARDLASDWEKVTKSAQAYGRQAGEAFQSTAQGAKDTATNLAGAAIQLAQQYGLLNRLQTAWEGIQAAGKTAGDALERAATQATSFIADQVNAQLQWIEKLKGAWAEAIEAARNYGKEAGRALAGSALGTAVTGALDNAKNKTDDLKTSLSSALDIARQSGAGQGLVNLLENATNKASDLKDALGGSTDALKRGDFRGAGQELQNTLTGIVTKAKELGATVSREIGGDQIASEIERIGQKDKEWAAYNDQITDSYKNLAQIGPRTLQQIAQAAPALAQQVQLFQSSVQNISTLRGPQIQALSERQAVLQFLRQRQIAEQTIASTAFKEVEGVKELTDAYRSLNTAQQQLNASQLQLQVAQFRVSQLDIASQQRRLGAAGDLADLELETLNRHGAIVNLQRQEADLADRQEVAARTNLALEAAAVRARQAARPAVNLARDIQYQLQLNQLQQQAIRANVTAGRAPAEDLGRIAELRQAARDLLLQQPQAELESTQLQRPGELIQRQLDEEQDARSLILIDLQKQNRLLRDHLIPLLAAQRLTDQTKDALNTQLEIQDQLLAREKARAAQAALVAQQAVSANTLLATGAQLWVDVITTGLNKILEAQKSLAGTVPDPDLVRHLGGGAPPAAPGGGGGASNVVINFTGPLSVRSTDDIDAIGQKAAQLALVAIAEATKYSPNAAPTGLAGAFSP